VRRLEITGGNARGRAKPKVALRNGLTDLLPAGAISAVAARIADVDGRAEDAAGFLYALPCGRSLVEMPHRFMAPTGDDRFWDEAW
jgi:hypothetical protein